MQTNAGHQNLPGGDNEFRDTADSERAKVTGRQWRHQDLSRGGAKLEIMSWGTHGKLQGLVQQLLDD